LIGQHCKDLFLISSMNKFEKVIENVLYDSFLRAKESKSKKKYVS
jgi:hypothetical protein